MEELNVFSYNSLKSANEALPARIAEIADEIRKETNQTKLNPTQISKIRERLGTWLVEGKQVNWSKVTGFNNIVTGKKDKLSIKSGLPKDTDLQYLTRANLENVTDETIGTSAARELKKRIAELDELERLKVSYKNTIKSGLDPNKGNIVTEINKILKRHDQVFNPNRIDSYGWGNVPLKDRNIKGFNKYINASKRDVSKIAAEIYKLTGIEGDIGHGWAALDDKGKRSIVDGMFGTNIGGKYGAENLAWQPRFASGKNVNMAQMDHWFYSLLSANRPHKQGATIQQLSDVYVGGKGWNETFDDFLMQGDTKNYFKFSRDLGNMEKSYVLFGKDGTPEIRLAQVEQARDFAKSTGAPQNFLDRLDPDGRYIAPTIDESTAKASKAAIPKSGQTVFGGPFRNRALQIGGTLTGIGINSLLNPRSARGAGLIPRNPKEGIKEVVEGAKETLPWDVAFTGLAAAGGKLAPGVLPAVSKFVGPLGTLSAYQLSRDFSRSLFNLDELERQHKQRKNMQQKHRSLESHKQEMYKQQALSNFIDLEDPAMN